jgi:Ca2+-binding RTX toxin-like protein
VASVLTGNYQDNLIVGNILNDNIRGDVGDDTLTGTSAAGSGEIDTLTGGTGADLFVLGNSANVFYNNLPGTGDYSYIRDFSVEQGDQLQLSGGATYFFDAGTGYQSLLYRDADGNQALTAGDNLIADIIATGGGGENKNLVSSDLAKIAIYA